MIVFGVIGPSEAKLPRTKIALFGRCKDICTHNPTMVVFSLLRYKRSVFSMNIEDKAP